MQECITMHIYTQTTTSSKELDIARSGVPATVHSFASRRCTTPEHRISGCCEHENNKKPLKLFPLIVLKLIYIYIYIYILSKIQEQCSIRHLNMMAIAMANHEGKSNGNGNGGGNV